MTRAMERLEEPSSSRPMPLRLRVRRWLMTLAMLSLAACGGGGGNPSGGPTLTVTPQTVSVSATLSDPAPTSSLSISANELGTGSEVFVLVHPTTLGIAKVAPGPGNTLPAEFGIQFNTPLFMGVGTYNDTIQVSMCFDQACSHPLYNSPKTIKVQYTVTKSTLPPLAIDLISPTSVTVGGPSYTLTVLGKGFSMYSYVQWNGVKLTTTYVSATEILAQVPAADIGATGTVSVTVSDPANSSVTTTGPQIITIAPASKDAVAFQNNAAHTGAVTFANLNFPSSATWSVDVGGTPSYAIVTQGKVIVTVSVLPASENLLALDQATGSTVWGPIPMGNNANATYDAGRVYVLSTTAVSAAGVLRAYDVNTGALDWSTTLSGQTSFSAAPTAADGMVYAAGSGMDGTLYAVDESTGALKWTRAISQGDNSAPAVSADGVYVTYPCQVYDIRPATGEVIWQNISPCSGGSGATPVVANQLLYAPTTGDGGNILNAETGDNVGAFASFAPPAFTSTLGYYLVASSLHGLSVTYNNLQWTFDGDGFLQGSPLAVNQYVFIGSSSGNLYAVDSTTGMQVWTVHLPAAIGTAVSSMQLTGLAAGDGLLIVPAGTKVFAYTLSTNP